jgi:hypothetical protein
MKPLPTKFAKTKNFVRLSKNMNRLRHAYSRIESILGGETEPLESVELVETYRQYMRPEKVRTLLLAESHVFTNDSDRKIVIPPIPELPGYPTRYARFVYCLGYGERMLTKDPMHPRRDGTPQFWKIFFSCVNQVAAIDDFTPILGQTSQHTRLEYKINILKRLKEEGVWLVDASIVALYKEGMKVKNMFLALSESWKSYTRDVVISANPEYVICIGKGVAGVVASDLERFFCERYTVIPQPNAFLSSQEHMANFQKYSELCRR